MLIRKQQVTIEIYVCLKLIFLFKGRLYFNVLPQPKDQMCPLEMGRIF